MQKTIRYRIPGGDRGYSNFAAYNPAQGCWYTTDRRVFEAFEAGVTAGMATANAESKSHSTLGERLRQVSALARAFNQITESSNACRCHGIILDYVRERAISYPHDFKEDDFWKVKGLAMSDNTVKVYKSAVRQYLKWEEEISGD